MFYSCFHRRLLKNSIKQTVKPQHFWSWEIFVHYLKSSPACLYLCWLQETSRWNKVDLQHSRTDSFQVRLKFTFPRKPAPVLTRPPCSVTTHKRRRTIGVTPGGQRSGAARRGGGSLTILLSESISSRNTWKRRIPALWCDLAAVAFAGF